MSSHYCYVDGESLPALLFDVRREFLRRARWEPERAGCSNTLGVVAVEIFDDRPAAEQLAILGDLLHRNPRLAVSPAGKPGMFAHATVAADYLVDLVCGAVSEVLLRDPVILKENAHRELLSPQMRATEADLHSPID